MLATATNLRAWVTANNFRRAAMMRTDVSGGTVAADPVKLTLSDSNLAADLCDGTIAPVSTTQIQCYEPGIYLVMLHGQIAPDEGGTRIWLYLNGDQTACYLVAPSLELENPGQGQSITVTNAQVSMHDFIPLVPGDLIDLRATGDGTAGTYTFTGLLKIIKVQPHFDSGYIDWDTG